LSDDTLSMLADAAAGFAKPDLPRVRKLRGTDPGFDRQRWTAMAEQGWFSVLAAEADGGLGLGLDACCVIAGKLGYGLTPEPFAAAGVMAPLALARSPNVVLRNTELAAVMAGEKLATVAFQGSNCDFDLSGASVKASPASDGHRLDGELRFIAPAAADAFIVAASTGNGTLLAWVPRDSNGLAISSERAADGTLLGRIVLNNVAVSAATLLVAEDRGAALLAEVVDAGLLVTAAELCGMMDRMQEMTLEYLRTRQQFGKAIGSFQALQHRSVDLWMQKQLAHAAVNAAASNFSAMPPEARSAAASAAKSRASDAALLIGKQSIQMHGAIGVTDEYDLGLYVNRSLVLSAWLGNGAMHRRRFGELAPENTD
jgi:alkylation response protein AidB-like acyl-CoA dehydrogenase